MTELPATELALTSSQVLAWIASGLLVFVSAGVIYLSAVDWRDRRRRRADQDRSSSAQPGSRPPARGARKGSAQAGAKAAAKPSSSSSRPPTAFGRRP